MWMYLSQVVSDPMLTCEASPKYDIITLNIDNSLHMNMTYAQAVRLSNELQAAIREFDNE
jgi:hypothetical protein